MDFRASKAKRLVARLARERLLASGAAGPAFQAYQFELRLASPRGEAPERMLQSPALPVGSA